MKKNVVLGIVTLMTVSATYTMPVHAEEGSISNVLSSVGVEEVFVSPQPALNKSNDKVINLTNCDFI